MRLNIFILLLLIPFLSFSQESDRIGIRVGYQRDFFGLMLNSNDYQSKHSHFSIGFERVEKHLHYKHFVYGVDFGIINHSDFNNNSFLLSLNAGKRTYFIKEKHFSYFGILLEYDFNAPNESDHLRQNGIGFFFSLGRELQLEKNMALSVMPIVSLSGFPLFNKGAGKDLDIPVAGGVDWGIKMSLQRKRYADEGEELN